MASISAGRIGIIAPSSQVPPIELNLGVDFLRSRGFQVDVAPQCYKKNLFFAGSDEERASAFFKFAKSSEHFALWCARGGHGALRLLPLLEKLTKSHGVPSEKLLIGYSDITALMEFVRKRWRWSTLHAPMPSMRRFSVLPERDWQITEKWIRKEAATVPWASGIRGTRGSRVKKFKFFANPPDHPITAPLVGGNLTVWNCLLGTRFQGNADGCILFLEDVEEGLYRIDRMMRQLLLSESLNRVKAIVLGNFLNCKDASPLVLKKAPPLKASAKSAQSAKTKSRQRILLSPKPSELHPLRKPLPQNSTMKKIFSDVGTQLGIPILYGLPVGHGPEVCPLPLGAEFELTPDGQLNLVNWDWIRK